MPGNEFQERAESEQRTVQAQQISTILEVVQGFGVELKAVKKELRTARAELRNLDKLRPLRSEKEESEEAAPSGDIAPEVTDQK